MTARKSFNLPGGTSYGSLCLRVDLEEGKLLYLVLQEKKQMAQRILALTVLFAFLAVPASAADVSSFESPPIFQSAQVLPSALRSGRHFRVAGRVKNDGYFYLFDVHSDFGEYKVRGRLALEKLVHEIYVLGELQKFTKSKVFVDAASKAGIGVLTAPVRAVQNVADALTNPDETVATMKQIPRAVGNVFTWAAEKIGEGAGAVAGGLSGKERDSGKTRSELTDKAKGAAVDYGYKYLGYSASRAKLFEKYGLDPYTTNQPLQEEIKRIAQVESAVHIGFKFVPGLGLLGALSTVNSYINTAKELSVYADPAVLWGKHQSVLRQMGMSEALVESFLANPHYSPTVRAFLLDGLERLNGVGRRDELVEIAAMAKSAEGAAFYARAVRELARWHRRSPLRTVITGLKMPAAVTRSREALAPLPLDYVTWTRDVSIVVPILVNQARKMEGAVSIRVHISGKASSRLASEFKFRGVDLAENVEMEGAL